MPAGPRIRANNVYGLVTDNPLASGATTMNSASLGLLPVVSSAHAVLVLDPKRVFGEPEFVIVTNHGALSSTAAITRAAYGTTARAHPMNTAWAHVAMDEDYIKICTSVTRPSNPYEGQFIYETDTNDALVYNGGGWVPFGGGGGTDIAQQPSEPTPILDALWLDTDESSGVGLSSIVGYAETSTSQAGITTIVDLTGLTVNVAVPEGRRLRVTGYSLQFSRTAGTVTFAEISVWEGATQIAANTIAIPNTYGGGTVSAVITPTAGSHTYKLRARTDGTVQLDATALAKNFILVEDITGTLWPAGTVITSSLFSSEAWTLYVPTFTNLTVGSGTLEAAYIKLGRTVHYRIKWQFGAGSAVGTSPTYTLPVPPNATYSSNYPMHNSFSILDAGTTVFQGTTEFASGSTVTMLASGSGAAVVDRTSITSTVPMTWTTNDVIFITGTYEAAS